MQHVACASSYMYVVGRELSSCSFPHKISETIYKNILDSDFIRCCREITHGEGKFFLTLFTLPLFILESLISFRAVFGFIFDSRQWPIRAATKTA
jgi:hypothetical protein